MPIPPTLALTAIDGTPRTMANYLGQVLLIVNVASHCGFTRQYAGLQDLHQQLSPRGFCVLGFPCDQFGHQEPDSEAQIAQFCSTTYGVTFPLFAKTEVNGEHAHPLYRALKNEAPGVLGSEAIKWNFTKFLLDRQGRVVKRYAPMDVPDTIKPDIVALLP